MTANVEGKAKTLTDRAVVVMAKKPVPGSTKTRLTPTLSPADAAALYECFLLDTIAHICARRDCEALVAIDEPESASYFRSVAPDVPQILQTGETLAPRLDGVLRQGLDLGHRAVFAIGSDSPDLPADYLTESFTLLDQQGTDVVLGPTADGGYYLIGWKQPWPRLVTDVEMSTPNVLRDTLAIADQLGIRVALGPNWHDVDEPDDIVRLRQTIAAANSPRTAAFLGRS